MHYLLPELTLAEAKTILQTMLAEEATDELVTLVYNLTRGSFRALEFFSPRYGELKRVNRERLARGEVQLMELAKVAAARLMMS